MTLTLLSAVLHAYVGWRLLPGWSGHPPVLIALAAVLVASALLVPHGLRHRPLRHPGLEHAVSWAALLFMGLFSSLFVLTALRDLVLLGGWLGAWAWPATLTPALLARLSEGSALAVPVLSLAASLWGLVNARRTAAVVSVDVPLAGLPPALHGFTIAQITDIHVGPTIKAPYLRAIVQAVNRLDADVVAITGDLIDGSVRDLAPHVAPLAELTSRHGTYFVTGNHEYYSGAHAWVAELRRLGLNVLMNQHVVLARGDAALVLAGVNDYSAHLFDPAHRSDPQAALLGAPASVTTRVLLAHQPRTAAAAQAAGFQLQISGHTHGGQFLPWRFFVRFQQPFTAGLHRWRDLWVYTSRGTGYWGPPKRLGAPSEITRLRLVSAPAA